MNVIETFPNIPGFNTSDEVENIGFTFNGWKMAAKYAGTMKDILYLSDIFYSQNPEFAEPCNYMNN